VRFFSGGGVGLLGCNPRVNLRTALCALTPIEITEQMRNPFPELRSGDYRALIRNALNSSNIDYKFEDDPTPARA
jgi:hypothetical protein